MHHLLRPPTRTPPLLRPISSLKVAWRKDRLLDSAIDEDKRYVLVHRLVRELLNEPGQRLPLRYFEKRRQRLRLPTKVRVYLDRYPNLFDLYPDQIKPHSNPSSAPVPFVRPSPRLQRFLADAAQIRAQNETLALAKLCKLLMMSRDRVLSAEKLFNVKRDFGLPDDFLTSLVPKYPDLVRVVGGGVGLKGGERAFVELVRWDERFARSVIETRAEEEAEATGIAMRPNFRVRLPPGFYLRREMREWIRDWIEMPYISPYGDAAGFHPASPEMEKRNVGLLHEVLSLSLMRRMAVPVIGKFCEEFRLSNAFGSAFTRHSGIFYVSLKGGVHTAMLREAYEGGVLVDREPLLEIKDKFVEMMEEGHREYKERSRAKREAMQRELENVARKNAVAEVSGEDGSFEEEDEI